jgi:phage portal protein BeeE
MLPAFEKGSREPNSILYVKEYTPEHRYYGLPDYVGALNWIDISYRIPKFNLDRFDNGFMPSAVVDLFGDAPEGMTAEQYIKDVVVPKFTGEGNNSKILFQMLDDETQKTNVQLFDNVKDGDFTVLQELADQNIISAHRWHPALSGIKSAGQLGNNQEIRNAFEIVKNTVIRGYQMKLNKAFDMMLEEAGFGDIKVSVHTKSPVSFIGDIDINSVLTTNEKREMLGLPPLEENEQTEQQEQENEE